MNDAPANPNKALWEKGDFTRLAATMRDSGEALVESLGIAPDTRILDLGCGDGTTALPAARRGAEVLGVDEGGSEYTDIPGVVWQGLRANPSDDDDEDDEQANMSLAAMESALKPRVLETLEIIARDFGNRTGLRGGRRIRQAGHNPRLQCARPNAGQTLAAPMLHARQRQG